MKQVFEGRLVDRRSVIRRRATTRIIGNGYVRRSSVMSAPGRQAGRTIGGHGRALDGGSGRLLELRDLVVIDTRQHRQITASQPQPMKTQLINETVRPDRPEC
ncbi:MAG: hypothetical protein U5O39_16760 [Gammaproteobacteria bacterium]|nr:hypothetical protein [Gammaproteobacteria bacterium]